MDDRVRTAALFMAISLAGACIALVFLVSNLHEDARIGVVDVRPYNPDFAGKRGALNVMMARGDGQGLAIMAGDPLLRSSPIPRPETAYLAQRPFVSMVAWSVSLGSRDRVPLGIAVSSVLGGAMATFGFAVLLRRNGKDPRFALAIGLLPGAIADIPNGASEMWGLGFAFLALAAWPEHRYRAVLWFSLAALCRETYLVVPAALLAWELTRRRLAWQLLLPPAAYGAWAVIVHARVGAWAWESHAGKLALPVSGIAHAIGSWGPETFANIVTVILMLVLAVHPLTKSGPIRVITIGYLALATVLGRDVWGRWENFGRVLLPLFAAGILSLVVGWRRAPRMQARGS